MKTPRKLRPPKGPKHPTDTLQAVDEARGRANPSLASAGTVAGGPGAVAPALDVHRSARGW